MQELNESSQNLLTKKDFNDVFLKFFETLEFWGASAALKKTFARNVRQNLHEQELRLKPFIAQTINDFYTLFVLAQTEANENPHSIQVGHELWPFSQAQIRGDFVTKTYHFDGSFAEYGIDELKLYLKEKPRYPSDALKVIREVSDKTCQELMLMQAPRKEESR